MKKHLFIVGALAIATCFTSCEESASKKVKEENVEAAAVRDANADKFAVMTFEEQVHDFGNIAKGERQEHTFRFTNEGEVPLVVTNVKSTCGCTVPKKPDGPIAPGEQGEIKVTYNGSGKNQVTKTITVTANTEKGKERISIKAFVEPKEGEAAVRK